MITVYLSASAEDRARLFCRAAEAYARREGLEEEAFCRIERDKSGKPYFADCRDISFSVSHSGDMWACAFAHCPLGLDIERIRPCARRGIERRFFHPQEAAYLADKPDEEFFRVWTAKESYVKYLGTGITDEFSSFSVCEGNMLKERLCGAVLTHFEAAAGYAACLCARDAEAVSIENI